MYGMIGGLHWSRLKVKARNVSGYFSRVCVCMCGRVCVLMTDVHFMVEVAGNDFQMLQPCVWVSPTRR